MPTIAHTCEVCGATFHTSRRAGRANRFCSNRCMGLSYRAPAKPCPVCGQFFQKSEHQSRAQYCSAVCYQASRRTQPPSPWTHCAICGVELLPEKRKQGHKYCGRACYDVKNRQPNPERVERSRQTAVRTFLRGQHAPTKIETAIAAALDAAGIAYVAQAPISNLYGVVWVCDFVITGTMIAVECDGDYWHSLPRMRRRDQHKDAYLTAAGYTVLRFWEHEIKADAGACVARIAEVMHG